MKKRRLNLMTLLIIIFISIVLFITFGTILIDNLFKIFTHIITMG